MHTQQEKNRLFDIARVQLDEELEAIGAKRDILMLMLSDPDFEDVMPRHAQVLKGLIDDEIDALENMKNRIDEIFGAEAKLRLVRVEDAEPNDYGITVETWYDPAGGRSTVWQGSLCVSIFDDENHNELAEKYAQALRVAIASGTLDPENVQTLLNMHQDPVAVSTKNAEATTTQG